MTPYHLTHAQLDWNSDGTPVARDFDDVYFSNENGLAESRYVFIQQNQLEERWQSHQESRFVIAETGFGTGLNFLATWQAFHHFRQRHPNAPLRQLHFISFEKHPLTAQDLAQAHQAWAELGSYAQQLQQHYPLAIAECHRLILSEGEVTLDLWFGDLNDNLEKLPHPAQGLVDAWFLDGFAPSKNPDMWTPSLFNYMAKLGKAHSRCATFTSAGFVRRGLELAGFNMQKVSGYGKKREMLCGELTQKPLSTTERPLAPYTPVSDLKEVAIIGGGIASAALALALARRNIAVTLYCQDEQAAQGASGNLQGAVYPLLNAQHDVISRLFAPAFLYARQFIQQAAQISEFDHQWCGLNQQLTAKLAPLSQATFPPELVQRQTPEQSSQQAGLTLTSSSLFYPLAGWVSPYQLTQNLLKALAQQGKITLNYQHKVQQLTWLPTQNNWQLTGWHQTAEFTANHHCVIIANGHQFDELTQSQALPLSKIKGQVSHIPTTNQLQRLKTVLSYDGYLTPHNPNNQQHCLGASYDRSQLNTDFDPIAQTQNRQHLLDCYPKEAWTAEIDISSHQARQAIRCVSRDHLPYVGQLGDFDRIVNQYQALKNKQDPSLKLAQQPNLYVLLGLGSRGLCTAPLLAEVLVSQLCGDPIPLPAEILAQLHPSRLWVRRLQKGKAASQIRKTP